MNHSSRSIIVFVVAVLLLALGGCAPVMPAATGGEQPMQQMQQPMAGGDAQPMPPLPTPEPGKLTVIDVRARPAPLEGGNGAAFLTVLNGLDTPVQLVSATGDVAAATGTRSTTTALPLGSAGSGRGSAATRASPTTDFSSPVW